MAGRSAARGRASAPGLARAGLASQLPASLPRRDPAAQTARAATAGGPPAWRTRRREFYREKQPVRPASYPPTAPPGPPAPLWPQRRPRWANAEATPLGATPTPL